jgi:predicted dehydrogenase
MKKPIRIGITGCGTHAIHHATHALKSGLKVVGVFDLKRKQMKKVQKALKDPSVVLCNSFEELLEMDIDAVIDASPEEFHLSNLRQIIAKGKHAFTEKPMATNIQEMKELMRLLEIAKNKNLVVTSCHIRRFDPPYVWVKNNLSKLTKKLGRVISVNMDFSYHKPVSDWKHGRSLLSDHANHEIDFINFVFGHADFTAHKIHDDFDRYELCGKRNDGITFYFKGTRMLKKSLFVETLNLRFEKGEVLVDTKRGIATVVNHNNDYFKKDRKEPLTPKIIKVGKTDYDKRLIGVMSNFARCINGKEKNYLTTDDLYVNNFLCATLLPKRKKCAKFSCKILGTQVSNLQSLMLYSINPE